jgi:membrane associated rhomboid family serine protease
MPEHVAICNLIVIGITVVASLRGFADARFLEAWLHDVQRILRRGEWHRLLTSGLVHLDVPHLAFNMFSLYSFGRLVERDFGVGTFLAVYVSAVLGGNLLSLLLHRREAYRALGASGGVCGVIYAAIFLLPGGSVYLFLIPFPIPSWLFALVYLLYSIYGIKTRLGNIGHDAHVGGAVIGLLTATALYPHIVPQNPWLYAGVMGISAAVFLGLLIPWRFRAAAARRTPNLTRREAKALEQHRLRDRRVDALLEKIAQSGMDSLTDAERDELFRLSRDEDA